MSSEYREYYEKWLSGLEEEIEFWKMYMEERGGLYFHGYNKTISPNRKFELEDDIPLESYGKEYIFIDIGSGPFSRCGRLTDKVKLNALSVDPLASVYKILKEKNKIDNGVKLECGFVELLSRQFPENTFDMVHMSNSLDHSFDAMYGLYQLLYICKIGGKVILRHTENEAERERYNGLHQWNLSLHNAEKSFVIWRNDKRYNISKLFMEYADIELYPDSVESGGGWLHNKVVMIKKKRVTIPDINYYDQMFGYTYDFLLKLLLKMEDEKNRKELSRNEVLCKRISEIFYDSEVFTEKIRKYNISNVDIYGMGAVGKALYRLLKKCGVNIGQVIDKNTIQYDGILTIPFTNYQPNFNMTKIIITPPDEDQTIRKVLLTIIDENRIMDITQFLDL